MRCFVTSLALVCVVGTTAIPTGAQRQDYRTEPFRVAVAIGESTTVGLNATRRERGWVSRLAELISESQTEPVHMINRGVGASVISPRSPAYNKSFKPSAMEHYQEDVVSSKPDLVLIAYGFNDARGGTPIGQFLEDVRQLINDIKKQTSAVIVVVNAYFMTDFHSYPPFNQANVAVLRGYNTALQSLAEELDVLYADAFAAEGQAPWMVDIDGIHANDLGHRVIANRIFEVLAQNCSCLSKKAFKDRETMKPWWRERLMQSPKGPLGEVQIGPEYKRPLRSPQG